MARDNKKYVYLTIGILRNSETHKALLADAEEHNTKQLPTIAGIRLSEYYQLKRNGLLNMSVSSQKADAQDPVLENDTVGEEFSDAMSNAADADDAWPD
jgi:hypothetical protein